MISFNEKSEETTIDFVNRTKGNYFSDDFTFIKILVYYWDEKIFCFSQRVNSIRGHESSLLVQRTYFRRRDYLDLKQF